MPWLRNAQPQAEARLWHYLRAGRLHGLELRRRHPVPPYIADVCCIGKKLVVGVDGSRYGPEVDARRTHTWSVRLESPAALGPRRARVDRAVLEAICNVVGEPTFSPEANEDERCD